MKIKYNIISLLSAVALMTACNDDLPSPTFTVGDAVNAITLRAGISDAAAGVMTKAGAEDHHTDPGHKTFTANTKLTLRVDGTWLGKANGSAPHGTISGTTVSQKTTATIGDGITVNSEGSATHNKVTFTLSEQLYWDDYGSADPANMPSVTGNGREKGLTIYGVAVDGETTAPTITSWTELQWNVGTPSTGLIDQTSGWSAKDLLTSNNIQEVDAYKPYATDGTYKFQNYIDDLKNGTTNSSNLLEFTHAMTKITVYLTAGEGFPGYETDAANAKFQTAPTVKLLGFNYIGKVNVETKTSTPTQDDGTTETAPVATADIKMHLAEGGSSNNKAKLDAIVFPGNTFSATIGTDANYTPTSTTDILELNADGNIYKVTAAQLVKAIAGTGITGTSVNGTLAQGKNYILNIIVNKTKIVVTATIKDWIDVNTEEAKPKINVTSTYGYTAGAVTNTTDFTKDYDLFRSTVKATGYDEDNGTAGINPAASYISSAWNKTIYWPNHQTHYFFRGVYPQVGTTVSGTTVLASPEAITTVSGNDVIAVSNAKYTTATYPSDLAIAIPRRTTDGTYDETCKNTGHTATEGICATEGTINLNFEYAMSKVEVRMKSSATDASQIELTKENTKVEIVGAYSKARIKLSDGLHDTYADADKANYTLSNLTDPVTGFRVTTCDAIVPQVIGDDVLFRITVTTGDNNTPLDPSDDPTDVYECKVKLIKETTNSTAVTEWVHGKHYIYVLDLNKTAIKATATLADWVQVNASDNVWF